MARQRQVAAKARCSVAVAAKSSAGRKPALTRFPDLIHVRRQQASTAETSSRSSCHSEGQEQSGESVKEETIIKLEEEEAGESPTLQQWPGSSAAAATSSRLPFLADHIEGDAAAVNETIRSNNRVHIRGNLINDQICLDGICNFFDSPATPLPSSDDMESDPASIDDSTAAGGWSGWSGYFADRSRRLAAAAAAAMTGDAEAENRAANGRSNQASSSQNVSTAATHRHHRHSLIQAPAAASHRSRRTRPRTEEAPLEAAAPITRHISIRQRLPTTTASACQCRRAAALDGVVRLLLDELRAIPCNHSNHDDYARNADGDAAINSCCNHNPPPHSSGSNRHDLVNSRSPAQHSRLSQARDLLRNVHPSPTRETQQRQQRHQPSATAAAERTDQDINNSATVPNPRSAQHHHRQRWVPLLSRRSRHSTNCPWRP